MEFLFFVLLAGFVISKVGITAEEAARRLTIEKVRHPTRGQDWTAQDVRRL